MGSCEPHPNTSDGGDSLLERFGQKIDSYLSVRKSNMMQEVEKHRYRHNSNMADSKRQHSHSETQTTESDDASENVKRIARDLAYDIVYYKSGVKKLQASSKYAVTLRRTADELLQRHEILFTGMVNKLDITQNTVKNVLDEMFKDNNYNWGRVVSLYAFAGRLARHAGDRHKQELIDRIAEWVAEYVIKKLSSWIHKQGGWDAFNSYFPEQKSLEDKLWRGLLVTAVGLGALATMVAVR